MHFSRIGLQPRKGVSKRRGNRISLIRENCFRETLQITPFVKIVRLENLALYSIYMYYTNVHVATCSCRCPCTCTVLHVSICRPGSSPSSSWKQVSSHCHQSRGAESMRLFLFTPSTYTHTPSLSLAHLFDQ